MDLRFGVPCLVARVTVKAQKNGLTQLKLETEGTGLAYGWFLERDVKT